MKNSSNNTNTENYDLIKNECTEIKFQFKLIIALIIVNAIDSRITPHPYN